MRDCEGFRDTRYQLLKARPAQRSSWVGYALSYHLIKDYTMALKVMEEYRKTQIPAQSKPDYEFNEMVLYECQLLQESGQPEEALRHLHGFEQHVCDLLTYWETKAQILYDMGHLSDAEALYRDLIHRNPENYWYFDRLEECLCIEGDEDRLQLYMSLQEIYRRSHSVRRIPLKFTTGDMFTNLVDKYLRRGLHKGMHSLFMSIRNLYSDPTKVQVIGDLVTGYVQSLRTHNHFFPQDTGPPEPPTVYLWSLYLCAQHYNQVDNSLKALELIDAAIDHTPTEVQLYMLKAKILKHAGDIDQAAAFMNEARLLDTADRFVNCKCVKYYLRSSAIDTAIETAGLFTREGLPPLQTMDEMQCMWFQTELARAYHRLGKLGEALQKLHEIDHHFVDIIDDQFDFHTYCMRKMTLRAYIGVLKLEDKLRAHPFYFACAKLAIEIYLYLYDNPSAKSSKMNGPAAPEERLSASELKKLQRKQKKAQLKAQAAKAAEEKTKEHKPHGKGANEEDKKLEEKGPKFDPMKLLQTDNALEEAVKFLIPLQTLAPGHVATHTMAYEVHSRRRKVLQMLQALKRLHAIDPDNGELHRMVVDYVLTIESSRSSLPAPVLQVINETLPQLTGGASLRELNQRFLDKHQDSLTHLIPEQHSWCDGCPHSILCRRSCTLQTAA
jgi:peptide alpha-N-acetyltransferase